MIRQHTFAWNGQSEGTKTPCWMANDALGQEKQRDYITAKPHLTAISIGGHAFIRPIFLWPIGDRIINRIPLYYPNSYYLFFSRIPLGCMSSSLLHSRFQCRHVTLLPLCGGALRDDTKNGCVADYMPSSKVFSTMWPFRAKGLLTWLVEDCENAHACTGWVKLGHKYLVNLQSSLLLIRMVGNNPLADKDATFNLQWVSKVWKVIMGIGF